MLWFSLSLHIILCQGLVEVTLDDRHLWSNFARVADRGGMESQLSAQALPPDSLGLDLGTAIYWLNDLEEITWFF